MKEGVTPRLDSGWGGRLTPLGVMYEHGERFRCMNSTCGSLYLSVSNRFAHTHKKNGIGN